MSGFVIDSSALIAILVVEPEADSFNHFLDLNLASFISAATVHEVFSVVVRRKFVDGVARLERILELIDPEIVAFDARQLSVARVAYIRYGRGTGHPAGLNLGDCFSYALAKSRNLPLLFKGDDFIHTDIEPALKPG
ncbi:type II toxin-antitoxin system VapC family toxin [Mesorhizobium sp. J428]|uniref:type II toxin-antitoxin system VapC family toxin n=1 Tax=Mesorhizobium sp. J428 TaxID=2898440 RepID=UPI00215159A3|nr:type II toxin-antitoxin system VapC family toxin [Mesorhizobium sp. J428]MCR5857769.1 type II toxin-antitoxin system VapC family toxin [Mesorhizobium sp. J428]